MMTKFHFFSFGTARKSQKLVSQANTKDWQRCCIQYFADHRHGIGACGRRITGAIGQKYAVRIMRQHLFGGCGCRQDGHIASRRSQTAQDVALCTIINGHNFVFWFVLAGIAFGPGPAHFIPVIRLCTGHFAGKVKPLKTGKIARGGDQGICIKYAVWIMCNRHMRRALLANCAG